MPEKNDTFLHQLQFFFSRTKAPRVLHRSNFWQFLYSTAIIGLSVYLFLSGHLLRFEHTVLDSFFQKRPSVEKSQDIVIIDIAKDSLQSIGTWPWPWHYHAEMIRILNEWGAKGIIFDVPFTKPETNFEKEMLIEVLKQKKNVTFPMSLQARAQKKIWVQSLAIPLEPEGEKKEWVEPDFEIKELLAGLGHHQLTLDKDGLLRRFRPVLKESAREIPQLVWQQREDGEDDASEYLINWVGAWQDSFDKISFADIVRSYQGLKQGLKPVVDPELVQGKICLIGLSVGENAHLVATPFETELPRVGVHASILNMALTDRIIEPLPRWGQLLALIGMGLWATFLFLNFHNVRSFVHALILGVVWIGGSFLLFWQLDTWVFVVQPLLLLLVLFIFSAVYAHVIASREQARLFDLATRDGLTGLYVIRYFREILNQVVGESIVQRTPLSLILIDIDNFKSVNDTYGHQAGDFILSKSAKVISTCLRSKRPIKEADFVARYGGEEFIMMLRNCRLPQAVTVVGERIRKAVEKTVFDWEGTKIPITISVGVSTLHPGENVPDFMVRRADEALYDAKRSGKNKVCYEKQTTTPEE